MLLEKLFFSYKSEKEKILCVNRLRFDFGVFIGWFFFFFFTKINIPIFDLRLFENPLQCFVKANKNVSCSLIFFHEGKHHFVASTFS